MKLKSEFLSYSNMNKPPPKIKIIDKQPISLIKN